MKLKTLLFGVLILPGFLIAQPGDSLQYWGKRMLNDTLEQNRADAERIVAGIIDRMLAGPGAWEQKLDTVRSISALRSPDEKFRIITWNLPLSDGTYKFFGRIEFKADKALPHTVVELNDRSGEIAKPFSKQLSADNWFGALYYRIILTRYKKKVYYTLLAWDGNTAYSNKKLIDVLTVSETRQVNFGAPVFEDPKGTRHRVIFEHAERASMSLRYVENTGLIVFDHLAPAQPAMEGIYEAYAPDFTTDAYKFEKGKWHLLINYEARNEKEKLPEVKKPQRGLQPER